MLRMLRDEGRLPGREEDGPTASPVTKATGRATRASAREVGGVESPVVAAAAGAAAAGARDSDRKSVLIVDDVASCRKISSTQLNQLGYQIIEAGEGAEALRLYQDYHAAISGILLDIMMPVMDGYETAREIRDMEAKQALKRMPIIAVTSLSQEEMDKQCDSGSFDGYVDKPTSMSKLQQLLQRMKISPDLSPDELYALGKAAAKEAAVEALQPHRRKRDNTPSSSDTTSDEKGHNGSNEGSDDQNGRKGSNSDRDPDARSSGDSGNEQPPQVYSRGAHGHTGRDNSSKRPVNGRDKTNSNENSSDASRQGSADGSREEKGAVNTARKTEQGADKDKAQPETKSDDKSNAGKNSSDGSADKHASDERTAPKVDAPTNVATNHAHLACARCGSEETRFCYYNNGLQSQPRHYCRSCQRYWTAGGTLRNLPKGSGKRKILLATPPKTKDAKDTAAAGNVIQDKVLTQGSHAQNEMQRAMLMLMTQVVGFDVDHAANNAGLVASRAGEEVASIVLSHLGNSSEAIEAAVTLAKMTGWRIGISISAVATAAVSQGLNQTEIAALIASQLPFLANSLVKEVTEQVKAMKPKSPSRDSNDSGSGGSGGTDGGGEFGGNTSAKSNSTVTNIEANRLSELAGLVQAPQAANVVQQSMGLMAAATAGQAAGGTGKADTKKQMSGKAPPMTMPAPPLKNTPRVGGIQTGLTSAFTASVPSKPPGRIATGSSGIFTAPFGGSNVPAQYPIAQQMPTISPQWLNTRFGVPAQQTLSRGTVPTQQAREQFLKSLEALGIPRVDSDAQKRNQQ